MPEVIIRDMQEADEVYVGSCTHVSETEEWEGICKKRIQWFCKAFKEKGLRIKVALIDGEHAGFAYLYPIEQSPWGPMGKNLATITCLVAHSRFKNQGVGTALIGAAEEEARKLGRKGVVIPAHYWEFPFMPGAYFEKLGYRVAERKGNSALLWKAFDDSAKPPRFLESRYQFQPIEGKVVVDLFYTHSCLTTYTEAERVRKVCKEFGDMVVLNQYNSDDPKTLHRYGVWRGIFVNGKEIGWGYEAPWEGIREAIQKALDKIRR